MRTAAQEAASQIALRLLQSREDARIEIIKSVSKTWVRSLGWEDPLEKEMATHSGILAWKIPWTEEHGRLQSIGSQESDMT